MKIMAHITYFRKRRNSPTGLILCCTWIKLFFFSLTKHTSVYLQVSRWVHELNSSRNFIRGIKSRRMSWAGNVARLGERRGSYRVLVGGRLGCDFGGLGVSVLASGTRVRGFKPGQSRRNFQGEKILSKSSFGGEVKPSVPCRNLRHVKDPQMTWKSSFQLNLSDNVLAHSSALLY